MSGCGAVGSVDRMLERLPGKDTRVFEDRKSGQYGARCWRHEYALAGSSHRHARGGGSQQVES